MLANNLHCFGLINYNSFLPAVIPPGHRLAQAVVVLVVLEIQLVISRGGGGEVGEGPTIIQKKTVRRRAIFGTCALLN